MPARARRRGAAVVCALGLLAAGPVIAQDVSTPPAPDPAIGLVMKRDSTRSELEALARSITLSQSRAETLERDIADLQKSSETLRAALVESAARRGALETEISVGEKRLGDLRGREDGVKASLRARRGLLAEVLAALQRMGRNPPPALLVKPEDALSSVRSAILLGAVVPGIRGETERLAADLATLSDLRVEIALERQALTSSMTASLEEERRTALLIAEKDKLRTENAAALATERQRAVELAGQATSLEGLISSLESELTSVRAAAEAARAQEAARRAMTDQQRAEARLLAEQSPDKNRIAPAYEFSDLEGKLRLPVTGKLRRQFGDIDGIGHAISGAVLETSAGAQVTAPADGWVVFAGNFRSYGEMIILNPGDGYHIVMSGMEAVNVRQGQFVVAGEPLAGMGAKRVASAAALALETAGPTLYIEFRKDGKPVDSQPWWTPEEIGKARNDS